MPDGLEEWLPVIALVCAIAAATFILLATRTKKTIIPMRRKAAKNEAPVEKTGKEEKEVPPRQPVKVERSVPPEEVDKAREDLRILNLEKEIVSFALTRLYEAEAEGKITKDDRVRLLDRYKEEMKELEKQISRKEMVVKLYELEGTQTELMQMFNTKLAEINREIEGIRTSLGLVTKEESPREELKPPKAVPQKPEEEEVKKKPSVRREAPKTEAEQRLEAIQEEVLKVLERLEQIETEA